MALNAEVKEQRSENDLIKGLFTGRHNVASRQPCNSHLWRFHNQAADRTICLLRRDRYV